MTTIDITEVVRGVAAALWGAAACVFIYTDLTLPGVVEASMAACQRLL
ncbi:hypothetical protein [Variovorax paradoxus]